MFSADQSLLKKIIAWLTQRLCRHGPGRFHKHRCWWFLYCVVAHLLVLIVTMDSVDMHNLWQFFRRKWTGKTKKIKNGQTWERCWMQEKKKMQCWTWTGWVFYETMMRKRSNHRRVTLLHLQRNRYRLVTSCIERVHYWVTSPDFKILLMLWADIPPKLPTQRVQLLKK